MKLQFAEPVMPPWVRQALGAHTASPVLMVGIEESLDSCAVQYARLYPDGGKAPCLAYAGDRCVWFTFTKEPQPDLSLYDINDWDGAERAALAKSVGSYLYSLCNSASLVGVAILRDHCEYVFRFEYPNVRTSEHDDISKYLRNVIQKRLNNSEI